MTFEEWMTNKIAGKDVYSFDIDDLREAWEVGHKQGELHQHYSGPRDALDMD